MELNEQPDKKAKKPKKEKKAKKALRKAEKHAESVRQLADGVQAEPVRGRRASAHATEVALRRDLVKGWAAAARAWGMAPACAAVHAYLLGSEGPVTTDDAMGALGISRGSAHTHLTGLVRDGFARHEAVAGSRRRGFVAVRDVDALVRATVHWRRRVQWRPLEELDRVARSPAAEGELGAGTAEMLGSVREVVRAARQADAVLLHLFGPPQAGR
jgi:DNA-binding transcriptional regulator GbsR (MarR family)